MVTARIKALQAHTPRISFQLSYMPVDMLFFAALLEESLGVLTRDGAINYQVFP